MLLETDEGYKCSVVFERICQGRVQKDSREQACQHRDNYRESSKPTESCQSSGNGGIVERDYGHKITLERRSAENGYYDHVKDYDRQNEGPVFVLEEIPPASKRMDDDQCSGDMQVVDNKIEQAPHEGQRQSDRMQLEGNVVVRELLIARASARLRDEA